MKIQNIFNNFQTKNLVRQLIINIQIYNHGQIGENIIMKIILL